MFIASFDSGNFDFVALGHDAAECDDALRRAWAEHVAQTGANDDVMNVAIADCEVSYIEIFAGEAARDGSVIA